MNVFAIIAIIAIAILSVIGVLTAKEPVDEVFQLNAAIDGFGMQPLSTKLMTSRTKDQRPCEQPVNRNGNAPSSPAPAS